MSASIQNNNNANDYIAVDTNEIQPESKLILIFLTFFC